MSEFIYFADATSLVLGALTGLAFGFLLQRAWVTRFDTIVGQFLLRDFTVMKVMGTAIIVGSVGVYGLYQLGLVETLHLKNAVVYGNALGGAIFAVGMVLLGYCPGTGVAAIGDGARDAWYGVLGMIAGAALYAEVHPWFSQQVLQPADLGKVTLADVWGVSTWMLIVSLAVIGGIGFWLLERNGAKSSREVQHA
ncbi:MAG: YeeE/YedE family protein [Bdellovibrionales bacterium]|nr:YeeE/YedE family protein [Bdellovibrionales bacterium]